MFTLTVGGLVGFFFTTVICSSFKSINLANTSLMTVHLFSSCPIGERKDICVADSFGKVFGQEGLFISDGSMLPSAPGVNPQGSIMAFAHRNIEKIITEA